MFNQLILKEEERALVRRGGRLISWLEPGRHHLWAWGADLKLERFSLGEVMDWNPELEALFQRQPIKEGEISKIDLLIREEERGLLRCDAKLLRWLKPGRHRLWCWGAELEVERLSLNDELMPWSLELKALFERQPRSPEEGEISKIELLIREDERGLLKQDGCLIRWLKPGWHRLWSWRSELEVEQLSLTKEAMVWDPELESLFFKQAEAAEHEMSRVDVILRENERGLLRRDGRLIQWLEPGRHRFWSWRAQLEVEQIPLDAGFIPWRPELEALLPEGAAEILEVPEGQIAAVESDAQARVVLDPGRYLLWQLQVPVKAKLYSSSEVLCEIPEPYWRLLGSDFQVIEAWPHQAVLLSVDGRVERLFEQGRYLICQRHHRIKLDIYDLREVEFQIVGQEVMSADKVTLRSNAIVKYRIVDAQKTLASTADLAEALYSQAQMAIRSYIAAHSVDALLEARAEAVEAMTAPVKQRAEDWGVEVLSVDLKDVVLPGEMKSILNQVIEAQKQAEANVILRREETAATRSHANTARVLANNPVLLRLKELELFKEIAGQIDHVTLLAGAGEITGKMLELSLPQMQVKQEKD